MLPVEFRLTGTPVSYQSHNRALLAAWRGQVATAARAAISGAAPPVAEPVSIHVVYYDRHPAVIPDEDNLLKPIQDALIAIVFVDDGLVTDGTCRKRDINGTFRARSWSRVLAEGFMQGDEFVHVLVDRAPDSGVLTP